MDQLILHKTTEKILNSFITKPGHALLISGPEGSGRTTIALNLAAQLVNAKLSYSNIDSGQSIYNNPYVRVLDIVPPNKTIEFDQIRELDAFFKHKVITKQSKYRILIIKKGHLIGLEAQNSLLKLIEEPNPNTIIIIIVTSTIDLLPTVVSRMQHINILKPPISFLRSALIAKGYDSDIINQAIKISDGLPALTIKFIEQNTNAEVNNAIKYAKKILSSNNYQRLLMIDEISKDKPLFIDICKMIQQMARVSLSRLQEQELTAETDKNIRKWQRILESSYQANEYINANVQIKLVVSNLMLSLS